MNQPQIVIPEINMELVRIRAALPVKLSELSRLNVNQAINLLRDWGDGEKPLRELYTEVLDYLDAATSE